VDKWAGVQFIDDGVNDDTVFASGGEGRLSLPLGEALSIQTDVKYQYNSNALESALNNSVAGPRYSYQGTTHLSWRDPSTFLLGGFGGIGASDGGYVLGSVRYDVSYLGGEAQIYANDLTFYVQGGYVDFDLRNPIAFSPLDDGYFGRGVVRWFLSPNSRLQIEGTYLNADYAGGSGDMEAFSVGARYDTSFNFPIIGETPLYLAYRGTFRDNCNNAIRTGGADVDDHTFMIGTSYSFSGDMLTVDRQGATLDSPNFDYACATGFQSTLR
jgi:hypothetical protein